MVPFIRLPANSALTVALLSEVGKSLKYPLQSVINRCISNGSPEKGSGFSGLILALMSLYWVSYCYAY